MNKTWDVWHCRLEEHELQGARYYAYRVDGRGPRHPTTGMRTTPRSSWSTPTLGMSSSHRRFDREAARRPGSNAGKAPLGVLPTREPPFDWGDDRPPRHEWDAIVYEMHVRGFTISPTSGVAPERRGTYAGIIDKVPYLKALGITLVELLPVHQFDPHEGNYWGYMPLNFFTPHSAIRGRP